MATAMGGVAFAGLTALAVGTAAPAGAQQAKPATQVVTMAPQQATLSQYCWNGDCGWGWDDDWDSWDYGWGGWGYGW
jgi:hypothetical protein